MITGMHLLLASADPVDDRAFLRDVLGWPALEDPSSGDGWLIFKTPPGELGVHPAGGPGLSLYLMCDDLGATLADLGARGVAPLRPPSDQPWGLVTAIGLPGGGEIGLYQPRHRVALDL